MELETTLRPGLLGRKLGMTSIFSSDGKSIPVTAIEAGPCFVLNAGSRGGNSAQLGFVAKKPQRVDKAIRGHFEKAGQGCFYHVRELEMSPSVKQDVGTKVVVDDVFRVGQYVDVSGKSIGRGFSGVVRRFKVKGQPATRGTHEYRRHIGAVGCRKFPGRIFKNKKMPGRMGGESVTVQNLEVIAIRGEDNVILVRGGIPGSVGSLVTVHYAQKRK